MASTTSPNMNLIVPGIGTENSPQWATDINGDLSAIDSHNHSSGQGVQITPNGMNINADLAFQNNNATLLRSTRFQPQGSVLSQPTDIGCLYVVGNELYYNDVTGGNNVQITSNGTVNATSSGISSGTASAAFSAGVLVVKSSSTSGANVLMQSAVLTNSGNLTNQLTVQAPALTGSYSLTLPAIPAGLSFVTIDNSGNLATASNVPSTQLLPQSITQGLLAPRSTGTTVGIGGVAVSASSGGFVFTSTSFVNVTNMSITITTTGRPVMVMVVPDGSSNGSEFLSSNSNQAIFQTYNSTSSVVVSNFIVGVNLNVQSNIVALDMSVNGNAGTYTYIFQARTNSGGACVVNYVKLVAYEI